MFIQPVASVPQVTESEKFTHTIPRLDVARNNFIFLLKI